ncbi:MAG: hypothetical protein ACJ789_15675 [Thermomicrobiales bacterium]
MNESPTAGRRNGLARLTSGFSFNARLGSHLGQGFGNLALYLFWRPTFESSADIVQDLKAFFSLRAPLFQALEAFRRNERGSESIAFLDDDACDVAKDAVRQLAQLWPGFGESESLGWRRISGRERLLRRCGTLNIRT